MNFHQLEILCLPTYPEYYEQTIALLNNQWPRSRTARLRSLEQGSKNGLPTSLILVQHNERAGKKRVVAHSKISTIPHRPHMCFIESVVVAPELRGNGLGRIIMQETEEYVKALGVTTAYLTTYDQQDFYRKLGYEFTDAIVFFGGSPKLAEKTDNLTRAPVDNTELLDNNDCVHLPLPSPINECENPLESGPVPPPPPPLPVFVNAGSGSNNNSTIETSKLTMKKLLIS